MSEESKELEPLSKKHQRVQDEYLICWNQTEAYKTAYPSVSHASAKASAARLFADVNFQAHLKARLAEIQMSADEALARNTQVGRADMSTFFKIVEEWTPYPLPFEEVVDRKEEKKEVEDEDGNKKVVVKVHFLVRRVTLDVEKLTDPRYAHLIKKFSYSPKSGPTIELYDAQAARRDVLKIAGKFTDRIDLTNSDGSLSGGMSDEERLERMKKLALLIAEEIQKPKESGDA